MEIVQRIEAAVKELGLDSSMLEIAQMVFNDYRPRTRYAYLFGNTEDNESSLFDSASQLQQKSLASKFLVSGGFEANGFPGYEKWRAKLEKIVGGENISPVPIEKPGSVNTYSEAAALVDYTLNPRVESIYIVSAQFHQLRTFATLASEALKKNPELNIFNYPGTELPWDEVVFHSQGTLKGKRSDFIPIELKKIIEYKNILPPAQILNYLKNRKVFSIV